ncbi:protein adenylyltransferase SelO [Paenibacillus cookii]|uniref:Protein nucleotidyltransferase YdiU n=1 Tax=Paenibacillus cookii TaxID=157839 RepID=A0ABQ4M3E1_9BACL|nr:YdiU family protein [Paenibacillus cookii]GIO70060.1 UPF0061 protein [Paenibacillus cookii]
MENHKKAGWNFDNSYARLPETFFSRIEPTPVRAPQLAILNRPLAESLGLDVQALQSEGGAAVLAGNQVPEGAAPIAQAYAGHQFGHFNMLGDGRAVLLGEQISPNGKRVDIQLKGSGRTPYSRGGDGRAALGPMLREYIISEAMHALGIPTTRSLAVAATGQPTIRESELPGAVLTRVASSHIRVGTFQYAAHFATIEDLRSLADYTISRHYPDIEAGGDRYLALLEEVIKRQASLIAKWQLVGFIHGVMNTDNMAISGETIDYGPCAFMDAYDPATVFSSIDTQGRYAYGNQPPIAGWNLARFAETLLPLLHDDPEQAVKLAQDKISGFKDVYEGYWLQGMRAKLGLLNEEEEDKELIGDLLDLMEQHHADYTNTFRALTLDTLKGMDLFQSSEFGAWHKRWKARLGRQQEGEVSSKELMRGSNPAVIPRNHRVEEALEAATEDEDFSVMEQLLEVLSNPYAYSAEQDEYCIVPNTITPYRTYCGT